MRHLTAENMDAWFKIRDKLSALEKFKLEGSMEAKQLLYEYAEKVTNKEMSIAEAVRRMKKHPDVAIR